MNGVVVRLVVCAAATVISLRAADVAYTGSRTCAGCHPKIYQDYVRTAMGRSMGATPGKIG